MTAERIGNYAWIGSKALCGNKLPRFHVVFVCLVWHAKRANAQPHQATTRSVKGLFMLHLKPILPSYRRAGDFEVRCNLTSSISGTVRELYIIPLADIVKSGGGGPLRDPLKPVRPELTVQVPTVSEVIRQFIQDLAAQPDATQRLLLESCGGAVSLPLDFGPLSVLEQLTLRNLSLTSLSAPSSTSLALDSCVVEDMASFTLPRCDKLLLRLTTGPVPYLSKLSSLTLEAPAGYAPASERMPLNFASLRTLSDLKLRAVELTFLSAPSITSLVLEDVRVGDPTLLLKRCKELCLLENRGFLPDLSRTSSLTSLVLLDSNLRAQDLFTWSGRFRSKLPSNFAFSAMPYQLSRSLMQRAELTHLDLRELRDVSVPCIPVLKSLTIMEGRSLSLDLVGATRLEHLHLVKVTFTDRRLDIPSLPALRSLVIENEFSYRNDDSIRDLDLHGAIGLTNLTLKNQPIDSYAYLTNLEHLYLGNLRDVSVPCIPALKSLTIVEGRSLSLDLVGATRLEHLHLVEVTFTGRRLYIPSLPALRSLVIYNRWSYPSDDSIRDLDLHGAIGLTDLTLNRQPIDSYDYLTKLERVSVTDHV